MTGRKPFWDRAHDTELIIAICDGLRPPIGDMRVPDGYIELMKECWNPDPMKRPTAYDAWAKIGEIRQDEFKSPTDLGRSSDIEPITRNKNSGAIYKSRPLSGMISSAMFKRSLRSRPVSSRFGNYKH